MAVFHSSYKAEASHALVANRNSEIIEFEINHPRLEAAKNTSRQAPSNDMESESAINRSDLATEASMPFQLSMCDPNIELTAISSIQNESEGAEHEFSLPPVDGGKDAWLFLFSAFVLEILVWGT